MESQTAAEAVEKFIEAIKRVQRRMIEADHKEHGIPINELEAWMLDGLDSYESARRHRLPIKVPKADQDQPHR
jgi:hypothetical protein